MCSTSAMVPVRLWAGISSARAMLAGNAAENAPELASFRNVRRSVATVILPPGETRISVRPPTICAICCGLVTPALQSCDWADGECRSQRILRVMRSLVSQLCRSGFGRSDTGKSGANQQRQNAIPKSPHRRGQHSDQNVQPGAVYRFQHAHEVEQPEQNDQR